MQAQRVTAHAALLLRVRKISPPPWFHPRTLQSVANRYTDWAIRSGLDLSKFSYMNYFSFVLCIRTVDRLWGFLEYVSNMLRGIETFWEAGSSSVSQEITHILWKLEVHHRVNNSPPLVPVMSHHFISFRCTLILSSDIRPCLPDGSFLDVYHQNSACISAPPHTFHVPRPSHSPSFGPSDDIWWATDLAKLPSALRLPVRSECPTAVLLHRLATSGFD